MPCTLCNGSTRCLLDRLKGGTSYRDILFIGGIRSFQHTERSLKTAEEKRFPVNAIKVLTYINYDNITRLFCQQLFSTVNKKFFRCKSTFFTKGYQTGENCKQKLISKYHKIP